jgi:gluconokinase
MARIDRQPQRVWSAALDHPVARTVVVVLMGVSGSGKTTVAALLAAALGCQFQEGDDLHPRENVEKMRSGTPLTDADRLPWLRKIAEEIDGWRARGECGVLTCSALKRSYRDIIIGDRHGVVLAYLKGSRDLIHQRMAARHEHFMPIALLDSQFATWKSPRRTSTRSSSMSAVSRSRSPTRSCVSSRSGSIKPAGLRQSPQPARERTDDHVMGVVAPMTTGYFVEATQSLHRRVSSLPASFWSSVSLPTFLSWADWSRSRIRRPRDASRT